VATLSSRLDEDGNWIVIEAAASGTFSKTVGGEGSSPITAFSRSLTTIDSITSQLASSLAQSRGVSVMFGIKIAPSGEVMLSGGVTDCQFQVTFSTPAR